jgi:O-antigen/teichoic acid export membrane protein
MENMVPVKAALHYKEGGLKQLKTYLIYITGRAGILVGGILLLLAIFRTHIIDFLYGAEYIEYSYLVIGFCLTYILVFIGHPLRFALLTLEITKPMFISYVLGAVFSLILAYPLVGQFGLVGVLVGIFVTQGLSQLVYIYYLKRVVVKN